VAARRQREDGAFYQVESLVVGSLSEQVALKCIRAAEHLCWFARHVCIVSLCYLLRLMQEQMRDIETETQIQTKTATGAPSQGPPLMGGDHSSVERLAQSELVRGR
jgi:hypothetical protein